MITVRGVADKRMATLSNGSCTYYADVPAESGGTGLYPRPGEYLMSAFAACMNMTTRGLLNERNASYEEVVTKVELDRSDLDHLTFFYQTEIIGDVPEEIRQQVLREAENCDVCRMLRAEKTFLPLDALNK